PAVARGAGPHLHARSVAAAVVCRDRPDPAERVGMAALRRTIEATSGRAADRPVPAARPGGAVPGATAGGGAPVSLGRPPRPPTHAHMMLWRPTTTAHTWNY